MLGGKSKLAGRGGISLLEVLISVGVLAIGMLGAATMLPLAKYYSSEANKFDRASTLGQQAYHDMQIRGHLSPKKWIDPVGSFTYTNQSVVMVDPLALTYAAAQGTPAPVYFPALPAPVTIAPYPTSPVPSSPIVFRANVDITNNWPDSSPQPSSTMGPVSMPFAMADRIFRATDDLIFDLPGKSDLRPQTPTGSLSPDFAGDFSWVVTISHTAADIFNAPNMQRLECSLVVFSKRDLDLNPADWPGPPASKTPPPERMVYADFLQPAVNGTPFYSGGSLQLRLIGTGTPPATTPDPAQTNWLDGLKPNTYLMLSANFLPVQGSNLPLFPRIGWYRIASVDNSPPGSPSRMITVDGPDWSPITSLAGAALWQDGDQGQNPLPTVFCTLVDNAVAVYNDVILLDDSLMRD